MFIESPLVKSALQKTFLPCKIEIKSLCKIMKQPLRAVSQKQPFTQ